MKDIRGLTGSLLVALLLSVSLAGCTGVLAPVSPTARLEVDVDSIHVGEAVNFDARSSTSPDPTLITSYLWDFGVVQRNSSNGYVSQVFNEPGRFEVQLTVVNDVGGEDSISVSIYVNALPVAADSTSFEIDIFAEFREFNTMVFPIWADENSTKPSVVIVSLELLFSIAEVKAALEAPRENALVNS